MSLRVFDYLCSNGHRKERFVYAQEETLPCEQCNGVAVRQLSSPRFELDGCSGDFPTAADAWEKRRESHMRKERKNVEAHDSYS